MTGVWLICWHDWETESYIVLDGHY
jgi:hypothetical protein